MITGNYSCKENYYVARDMGSEEPTEANEGDDVATSRDQAEHGGQEHHRQGLIDRRDGHAPTLLLRGSGNQIGRGRDAHGRTLVSRPLAGGGLMENIAERIIEPAPPQPDRKCMKRSICMPCRSRSRPRYRGGAGVVAAMLFPDLLLRPPKQVFSLLALVMWPPDPTTPYSRLQKRQKKQQTPPRKKKKKKKKKRQKRTPPPATTGPPPPPGGPPPAPPEKKNPLAPTPHTP